MNSEYIVDPSDSIAQLCSENGIFLEDDYYMAMSHNEVPSSYWKRSTEAEQTERKIVILGAYETPMTVTKSAFIAQTLAKPKKLTVKVSGKDEAILLNEMFKQNEQYSDCKFSVYQSKKEELASSAAWLRDVEEATDLIIFGSLETLYFLDSESTKNQNVWIHKPKFSFGVVSKECLEDEDNLAGLVGDFISYYGEGTLAPRFYATLGKLSNDQMTYIADAINNEQDIIQEFRNKLPFSKKFMQIQTMPIEKFIYPHVKKSSFESPEFLSPLFGDVRLVELKNEIELENFFENYEEVISSVAMSEDVLGDIFAGLENDIPRYCDIGSLQFPYFYEPYDHLDDLYVYGDNVDML